MDMEGLDDKPNLYGSHSLLSYESLEDSQERNGFREGSGFRDHFILPLRNSVQQQESLVTINSNAEPSPKDMRSNEGRVSSSTTSPSAFMSQPINFYSNSKSSKINITGGDPESVKKSKRYELESEIPHLQALCRPDNWKDVSEASDGINRIQSNGVSLSRDTQTNSIDSKNIDGHVMEQLQSISARSNVSQSSNENSDVHRSSLSNGKLPLLPFPMRSPPSGTNTSDFKFHTCVADNMVDTNPMWSFPNADNCSATMPHPRESHGSQTRSQSQITNVDYVKPEPANPQKPLHSENSSIFRDSCLDVFERKLSLLPLPYPIGRSSSGKCGLPRNRFLDADTMLNTISQKENTNSELWRQAPALLDFHDDEYSIRLFDCSSAGQRISASLRKLPLSPMDHNYSLISNYVEQKSDSLTESKRMELSSSEAVMRVCEQRIPVPMNLIFSGLKTLEKVGEGVFGEVFSGYFIQNEIMRVYKIVAIEGSELVNGEKQKTYAEILPEIIISRQLSKLHDGYKKCFTDGFIKLHNVRITRGSYPTDLVAAWKAWDKKHNSDNDCPEFKTDQLYVVFEYDHGGDDVESFYFVNARQAFYLTLQVAHILAVGECSMEMEHRDLHWGNILVEKTEYQNISYHFNGKTRTLPSFGVKACIIDFTIARLVDDDKHPIFLDLKEDEEQFLGTGDHQFDIYRMMRDLNRNEWAEFFPKTNVFWIHYLAEKFFVKGRYTETSSYVHQCFMKELRQLKDSIMEYASCTEFVFSPACDRYKELKVRPASGISQTLTK